MAAASVSIFALLASLGTIVGCAGLTTKEPVSKPLWAPKQLFFFFLVADLQRPTTLYSGSEPPEKNKLVVSDSALLGRERESSGVTGNLK
ncbi:hypothetical protein COP1_038711 [Malus domestica]